MDEHPTKLETTIKSILDEILEQVIKTVDIPVISNIPDNYNYNPKDNDDLRELYKYVNAVQVDIHRHTDIFIEIWKLLQCLITKMIKFEEVPSTISELTASILTLQESNKKISTSITNVMVKSNDNKSRIKKIRL